MSLRLLSIAPQYYTQRQVCMLTCLSRSSIERMERAGVMPPPRRFGARCKRYPAILIQKWMDGEEWQQGGAV
jgi:predicted DNA-binding transcriptional regulator AlpA